MFEDVPQGNLQVVFQHPGSLVGLCFGDLSFEYGNSAARFRKIAKNVGMENAVEGWMGRKKTARISCDTAPSDKFG